MALKLPKEKILLALTRKSGQSIILTTSDGDIAVYIQGVHGPQVSVAIDAPQDVGIWRNELFKKGIMPKLKEEPNGNIRDKG